MWKTLPPIARKAVVATGLVLALILLCIILCPTPQAPNEPTVTKVERTTKPYKPVVIALSQRRTPNAAIIHTLPDTALRRKLDSLPSHIIDVQLTTKELRVTKIDTGNIVTTQVYVLNPKLDSPNISIDARGFVEVKPLTKTQRYWQRNKHKWKAAGIAIGAGILIGATSYTTYRLTR